MRGVAETSISEAINGRLNEAEKLRVKHLTWGRHTATNEHRAVEHVLLMGLNFVPRAASVAASGAALDKSMRTADPDDHPTKAQVDDMRVGMLRDATLQALLRGNARRGRNGDCGVMEAVIPQVLQTGLSDDDYRGMFPGVTIVHDRTLIPKKPLRGHLKTLSEIVVRRRAEGVSEISYRSLREAIEMKSEQNFATLMRKPEWIEWAVALGLVVSRLKSGGLGFRSVEIFV